MTGLGTNQYILFNSPPKRNICDFWFFVPDPVVFPMFSPGSPFAFLRGVTKPFYKFISWGRPSMAVRIRKYSWWTQSCICIGLHSSQLAPGQPIHSTLPTNMAPGRGCQEESDLLGIINATIFLGKRKGTQRCVRTEEGHLFFLRFEPGFLLKPSHSGRCVLGPGAAVPCAGALDVPRAFVKLGAQGLRNGKCLTGPK